MSLESRMNKKRESLLSDLVHYVERCLLDHEIPPEVAATTATSLAARLADYWGGQNFTFPKDYMWKLGRVELEIYDQVHGDNLDEVARKYNMSVRGLRKLMARVRDRIRAQARLSEIDDEQLDLLAGHSDR